MQRATAFEDDIRKIVYYSTNLNSWLNLARDSLEKKDTISLVTDLGYTKDTLLELQDLFLKYGSFFEVLKEKFGIAVDVSFFLKAPSDIMQQVVQMNLAVVQSKFEIAGRILEEMRPQANNLRDKLVVVVTLPQFIEYSRLSNKEWRMIGIAGVHYRSKIFLSYHFRDKDPKKDENQLMIDYYIKPTLELLNIIPVTARDNLKSQELIDDDTIKLVNDCDGIVGFYTANDSIENVEHELANSGNVIAICKEDGARPPSMRLSRLLVEFKRNEIGDLLIRLVKTLKESKMFELSV